MARNSLRPAGNRHAGSGQRRHLFVGLFVAALAGMLSAALFAAGAGVPARAASRVTAVDSVAELRTAVANALPGEVITLADGRYSAGTAIELSRSGTADLPITITAVHSGMAEISGTAGLKIKSSFLVIKGIRFTQGATVSVPSTSHHVRLTRNIFQLPDAVTNYVMVSGDDVQVDYNTFQNKRTVGVFLSVSGPGTAGMAQRTWVHHNYFVNHSYAGDNGGESIRLGTSARQHSSAYAKVEYNVLSSADGDREAISVKSSDNVVRFNRIEDSAGTITLRHGERNRVDGNLLIGGSTGIRVFGNGHTVVNNVVQSSDDTALSIDGGEIRDDLASSTLHDAADNVLVAFNTVAYNASNMIRLGDYDLPYPPQRITIVNNIVRGSVTTPTTAVRVEGPARATWGGNMLYGVTPGGIAAGGYQVADPRIAKDSTGVYRLATDSPAIGAAVGSYGTVTRDMDGQDRPAALSVGADDTVSVPLPATLLTKDDVGPKATEVAWVADLPVTPTVTVSTAAPKTVPKPTARPLVAKPTARPLVAKPTPTPRPTRKPVAKCGSAKKPTAKCGPAKPTKKSTATKSTTRHKPSKSTSKRKATKRAVSRRAVPVAPRRR